LKERGVQKEQIPRRRKGEKGTQQKKKKWSVTSAKVGGRRAVCRAKPSKKRKVGKTSE